jgi:hypothetical protein
LRGLHGLNPRNLRNPRQEFLPEEHSSVIKNLEIEELFAKGLGDGDGDNFSAAQGRHLAELFVADQLDGFQADARGEHAIGRSRSAAALDVTENGDAGFNPGELFDPSAEPVADPAQLFVAEVI